MRFIVEEGQHGRLDAFLSKKCPDLSRARIQTLIKNGDVKLNQAPSKAKQNITAEDTIEITIPEPKPLNTPAEELPLDILFEDEDIIVLNKASGMVVHPAAGNDRGTLVNALLHHCKGNLSGIGGIERPGIVHRLDKDTSGCIIVAKSDTAHQSLVEQFSSRTTKKRYLAVTQGPLKQVEATVSTNIGRHPVNRLRMAVVDPPKGKTAVTDYQLLYADETSDTWFVHCDLHTGRTHQIRVHMLHSGNPLLGDEIYSKPARQKTKPGRLMLHAWQLEIEHPISKKRTLFRAQIPKEFEPWSKHTNLS